MSSDCPWPRQACDPQGSCVCPYQLGLADPPHCTHVTPVGGHFGQTLALARATTRPLAPRVLGPRKELLLTGMHLVVGVGDTVYCRPVGCSPATCWCWCLSSCTSPTCTCSH